MPSKYDLAKTGIGELERSLTTMPPPGVSGAEIAAFFVRQRDVLTEALAKLLRQINASLEQVFKLNGLIYDGVPFDLTVESDGKMHRFAILPDVDGIEVLDENSVSVTLDAEDGPTLLDLMPRALIHLQGGNLVEIEEESEEQA